MSTHRGAEPSILQINRTLSFRNTNRFESAVRNRKLTGVIIQHADLHIIVRVPST